MIQIIKFIQLLTALVITVVELVEEPGNGVLKRQRAITLAQDGMTFIFDVVKIPGWIAKALGSATFLGWIIDIIVSIRNSDDDLNVKEKTQIAISQ